MMGPMKQVLLVLFLTLGIAGLILEQRTGFTARTLAITSAIDYCLTFYLLVEFLMEFFRAPVKRNYIRRNLFSTIFLVVYLLFFTLNQYVRFSSSSLLLGNYLILSVIRNTMLLLKIFGRVRKLTSYLNSIFTKPAQTVVLSFLVVILIGTLVLMMPFMSRSGGIGFVSSLFTVTSAVCVTGLVVVDTSTYFTTAGQAVIMVLIQIGGLGIMLLSYFMVFSFRRALSLKDRQILSYMLNAQDMAGIKKSVKRIILLTFGIELAGAVLLFPIFFKAEGLAGKAAFFSLFHGISAFCNAGFALYSDSLSSFSGNLALNGIIACLIIAGGISFGVLTELGSLLKGLFRGQKKALSINTRVVLLITGILILGGMLFFYKLEHSALLYPRPLAEQYLGAFFQSVTLRTAGFNTLPLDHLAAGTLLFMMGIMFIGGASGSTAGGIKVNTLGVVFAYVKSFRRGQEHVLLYKHQIPREQILHAFTVILFGGGSVFTASFILMLTENLPPMDLLFESVSAFATVGLSTGITSSLSFTGRLCIIILMFIGRLGPLTLLTASSGESRSSRIAWPEASLLIG